MPCTCASRNAESIVRNEDPITEEHLALIREAESYVAKWQAILPWLYEWTITVAPMDDDEEESPLLIELRYHVRHAVIYVAEDVEDEILAGDHGFELGVLHELCHVLIQPMCFLFQNWVEGEARTMPLPAFNALSDVEEVMVWHICRALINQHYGESKEIGVWDSDRGA